MAQPFGDSVRVNTLGQAVDHEEMPEGVQLAFRDVELFHNLLQQVERAALCDLLTAVRSLRPGGGFENPAL